MRQKILPRILTLILLSVVWGCSSPPPFAPPWVEDARLEDDAKSYVDGLLAGWRNASSQEKGLEAIIIGAVRAPGGVYVDILVFGAPRPAGPTAEQFSARLAQGSLRYFSIQCGDSRIPIEPRSLPPAADSGILHVSHSLIEPAVLVERLEGGGELIVRRCGLRVSGLDSDETCAIIWSEGAYQELASYARLSQLSPQNSLE